MDGVIAAAMLDAKTRTSSSGATTDVSENLTPPPQKKTKPIARKSRLVDASSLGAASSTTLLDAFVPAQKAVDSDSATGRKKARTRKSHAKELQPLKKSDNSTLVLSSHNRIDSDSPPPLPSSKSGADSSIPLAAPPSNQKGIQKPSRVGARPEGESTSEDEDSDTPKKKPVPISDPDDELDAFLQAPANPSQKSVLEDLPSHSESEEDDMEREDIEVDEEDDVPKSKGTGHGQLIAIARPEGSSGSGSDSESVAPDVLVNAKQVGVASYVFCAKLIVEI